MNGGAGELFNTFILQLFDGWRIGFVLIDVDAPWILTFSSLHHLAEESFGGPFISPGAEHEVDRLTSRIYGAVKVFPRPFHFDIGFIDAIGFVRLPAYLEEDDLGLIVTPLEEIGFGHEQTSE
jgi:hypothetical protein